MPATQERMDEAGRRRMTLALDRVSDLLEAGGVDAEGAFVKACAEHAVPAGHVPLMARAFNTGRANFHRRSGSTVLEKASSVPLVDAARVAARLDPAPPLAGLARVKAAAALPVSADYALPAAAALRGLLPAPPGGELASPEPPPPAPVLREKAAARGFHLLRDLDFVLGEARVRVAGTYRDLVATYKQAAESLRAGRADCWAEVRGNFVTAHGADAEAVCKHLEAAAARALAKSAGAGPTREPVRWDQSPYREMAACLKAARAHRAAGRDLADLAKRAAALGRPLRRRLMPKAAADDKQPAAPGGRGAALLSGLGSGFTGTAGWVRPSLVDTLAEGPTFAPQEDEALAALTSPDHELRLQQVRSKAMLSDLLANDPVVSGHPPEEVVSAFNELRRVAPRALAEPAVARALLRRHLSQGGVDAHELQQLADTELSVRRSREPLEARAARGGQARVSPLARLLGKRPEGK